MAREGLRTLVVGKKVLSEEHYSSFEAGLRQARLSVIEREEQVHMHTTIIYYTERTVNNDESCNYTLGCA